MSETFTLHLTKAAMRQAGTDPGRFAGFKEGRSMGEWIADALIAASALRAAPSSEPAPIPMVLFCPACGVQHIDEPEEPLLQHGGHLPPEPGDDGWDNPPHRSHRCLACGHIWRPADVPTTGVEAVQTKGKADSPIRQCSHPSTQVEREEVARAISDADASFAYSAELTRFVDGVATYRLRIGDEAFEFTDTDEASASEQYSTKVSQERDRRRADAVIALIEGRK